MTPSGRQLATGRWRTAELDLSDVLFCGSAAEAGRTRDGGVAGPAPPSAVPVPAPPNLPAGCVVHALRHHPGAFHVAGALSEAEQAAWARAALGHWTESARSNLSATDEAPAGLWLAAVRGDFWDRASGCWRGENELQAGCGSTARTLLRRRRWATLGATYDWTSRTYEDAAAPAVPAAVAAAASRLAAALTGTPLRGDAALVNYYGTGDGLGPHRDDAETCGGDGGLQSPIVAFSLGCPAIFLLGHADGVLPPTALLLRSGDAVVMSGPARSAPHALPRVLTPGDTADPSAAAGAAACAMQCALAECGTDASAASTAWMQHSRISVSVRDLEGDRRSHTA